MSSAAFLEFVNEIARRSARGVVAFLRRWPRWKQEDILQEACLQAWDRVDRAQQPDPDVPIAFWFEAHLHKAARDLERQETPRYSDSPLLAEEAPRLHVPQRLFTSAWRPDIDHEIEKLLSGPRVGMKDCPPCWRCMYFEGWTPNMDRYKQPTHVDPEIAEALREIERRKINIGFGHQPEDNVK